MFGKRKPPSLRLVILSIFCLSLFLFAIVLVLLTRGLIPGLRILNYSVLFLVAGFFLLSFFLYIGAAGLFLLPLERLIRDVYRLRSSERLDLESYVSSREMQTLCISINDMMEKLNQSMISTSAFKSMLNGMGAYLYVTNIETDEVLFINDSMKLHYGLDDRVLGRRCWEVFQTGFTERCPFCPMNRLTEDPGAVIEWEEHNSVTGRYYKNTDRLIEWEGNKFAHLRYSIDISDLKAAENSLTNRLKQQEFVSAVSQSFISNEDIRTLINNALRMIGEFMKLSKAALVRFKAETNTLEDEYDWYHESVFPSRPPRRIEDFAPRKVLFDTFILREEPYLICNDTADGSPIGAHLIPLGVRACICVPIYVYGTFWGVLNVEDWRESRCWDESDVQINKLIANVIAGVLIRNDTEAQLIRMSSIVNSSPQYIAYISSKGQFKYLNQGVIQLSGYSREELNREGIGLLFSPKVYKEFTEEHIPTIQEYGTFGFEVPMIRKDGRERLLSVSAFTTGAGQDGGIGIIAVDITDQRQMERDLITAKEQAIQSSQAKGNFLARMSHEMRTPMNAIIGMTAIAQNSGDEKKMEYCLSKISEASIHLLGVINDILDMSKIEAGKFELSYSEFDLGKMITRVINVMNFRFEERKQHFILELDPPAPGRIIADEQRLAQVLTNLLSNAGKFTPEKGNISLKIRKTAEQNGICTFRMEVSDTGIGITKEQQGRLFSLFEQADGSIARKYGGTGLGLAISKSIVELMGGEIWVHSEPGRGSSFGFELSVERGRESQEVPAQTNKTAASPTDGIFTSFRMLLAEDVAINREIALTLLDNTGISIDCAENGTEAVAKFEENPAAYQLILMDIHMPEMDGFEATRRIRALKVPQAKTVPILAMTANVFREDIEKCLAAGMNDHLGKPIDVEQMMTKLKQYLIKNQGDTPPDPRED
jgi:PAS domain S-box-containing protein